MIKLTFAIAIFLLTMPAQAYLGPGMGAGAFAVTVGILGSIFLALFAVIYYPFKRMLKRNRAAGDLERESEIDNESLEAEGKLKVEDGG